VPPALAESLERNVDANRYFDGLSQGQKQRYVLPIEQAKTAETR